MKVLGKCWYFNRPRLQLERSRRLHPNLSINVLSLLPAAFDRQVEVAARLGALAITPDIAQLDDVLATQAARWMDDAGLQSAALTHRAFGFADAAETEAACERLERSIEYAATIGANTIMMTTGGRGALNWGDAAKRFAEAIAPIAALARQAGIELGIEPTSHLYADASIAHRLSDCTALARLADISVVIDLFACWTDADIDAALSAAGPHIALVQVSDYVYGDRALPCRAVPGDGAIPLDRLIPAIVLAGFTGTFDLEIIGPRLQTEGVETGLKRAAETIGGILEKVGLS
jgi:sugar phosphate isomerase/epimerase